MKNLRSEKEIMKNWRAGSPTMVSICCATYNHVDFIENAIEGFLIQETSFPFEILIHDDASDDGTAEKVKSYELRYPNLIKAIYQSVNQYSLGLRPGRLNYERARGVYVAICEGDDCWISSKKLNSQVEYLQRNNEFNLCFHPAVKIDLRNKKSEIIARYRWSDGVVPVEEIIEKKYGQVPMASIVVKRKKVLEYLEFRDKYDYISVGDIYIQFFGSNPNGALYINSENSIYRFMASGSWNHKQDSNIKIKKAHTEARILSYRTLNEATEYQYDKSFKRSSFRFLMIFIFSKNAAFEHRNSIFRSYSNEFPLLRRLVLLIGVFVPRIFLSGIKKIKSLWRPKTK